MILKYSEELAIHCGPWRRVRKEHIGFYPPVRGDAELMNDLARYAGPNGNLRFPLNERIPYGLIARIVKARSQENRQRAEERRAKTRKARTARRLTDIAKTPCWRQDDREQ